MKKTAEMTEKECLAEIDANEAKRLQVVKDMEPLKNKCSRLYNRNERLQDRIAQIKKERAKKSKRTDWKYVLSIPYPESSDHYKYCNEVLESIGLMGGAGYFQDTRQTIVRIALTKGDEKSLKQTLKGLRKVLPHIIPRPEDGCKWIDIFERHCSEFHSWYLLVDEDKGAYKLHDNRSSFGEDVEFATLRDAIAYIQKHIWYESKNRLDHLEEEYEEW